MFSVMGIFNRYLDDVHRVGEALTAELGWPLVGPGEDHITWAMTGKRGGSSVKITLNHMHGVHGVECEIRPLPLDSLELMEENFIFAGERDPYVTERLKVRSMWDGGAFWLLLPEATRHTLEALLSPKSSSLSLRKERISALLGPIGMLRSAEAAATILRNLDQLMALVPILESHWDVDPAQIGGGRGGGRPPMPVEPPKPPPPPVEPRGPSMLASLAIPARDAMIARVATDRIEPFPAGNPLIDTPRVAGRIVVLPPLLRSNWVSDWNYPTMAFGGEGRGWYFARSDAEGFARLLRAVERFEKATGTKGVDYAYEVIGRIREMPMLVVAGESGAQIGFGLEILGAYLVGHVFVDVTKVIDGESPFVGELDDSDA